VPRLGARAAPYLRAAQAPLVIALFGLLAWRTDLRTVGEALSEADLRYIGGVVALNLVAGALFALRSHVALRRLGYTLRPALVVSIAILGNVAGAITPASSGEVLRAGALTSHAGVSLEDAAGLVLFERALSLFYMTLGTAAVGVYFFLPVPVATALLAPLLCLAASPWAVPLLPRRGNTRQQTHEGTLRRALVTLRDALGRGIDIARDQRTLAGWSAVTLVIYGVNTLQFWLLAESVGSEISAQEAWVALGASQLAGIVSLIPLGFGASDWSLAAILRRFGMTLEQGTAVAVLVRGATTLPLLLMAFASYLYLAGVEPARHRDDPAVLPD